MDKRIVLTFEVSGNVRVPIMSMLFTLSLGNSRTPCTSQGESNLFTLQKEVKDYQETLDKDASGASTISVSKKKNTKIFLDMAALTLTTIAKEHEQFLKDMNVLLQECVPSKDSSDRDVTKVLPEKEVKIISYTIEAHHVSIAMTFQTESNVFETFVFNFI